MLTELERIIEYRRHVGRLDPVAVNPLPTPEVRLTVVDAALPTNVPAELADVVSWSERRQDWSLNRVGADRLEAYLGWRATWESTFSLGTVADLRELRHAVALEGLTASSGYSVLERLTREIARDGAVVTAAELAALRSLVADFSEKVRSSSRSGTALVDASPTIRRVGLLRSWPERRLEHEVSSRGTVTVRLSGHRMGVWFADDREPIEDVQSFEFSIDGAVVRDADEVEHVLDHDATEAVAQVAPETTAWRVRRVPEILVWANVSAALETAADAVALSGNDAFARLGDVRHDAIASGD